MTDKRIKRVAAYVNIRIRWDGKVVYISDEYGRQIMFEGVEKITFEDDRKSVKQDTGK